MKTFSSLIIAFLFAVSFTNIAAAQGTNIAFGGLSHDTSLPIEITADQLEISQADGTANFYGNVIIGQGEVRLSADSVHVEYATENGDSTGEISRLIASGGVTFVNGSEAAEAQEAIYTLATGEIIMTGGVILTQGRNALSSDRLVINLKAGTGRMEGRVKTILQTGGN